MNENNIKTRFLKMWGLVLSVFGILFMACVFSGCSFKYFDPQYYKFKRLCKKEAKGLVLNNILFRGYLKAKQKISFYDGNKFYDKTTKQEFLVDNFELKSQKNRDISNRLREFKNVYYYKNEPFYEFLSFSYNYKGIFLQGDEAAGWCWEYEGNLYCEKGIIKQR